MSDSEWLDRFKQELEALEDEGLEGLLHAREESRRVVRWLAQSMYEIARAVDEVRGRCDGIARDVARLEQGREGAADGGSSPPPGDDERRRRMEALIRASVISTSSLLIAAVPAVGTVPRDTPYLENKRRDPKSSASSARA